jgi:hypothetical protein
MLTTRRLTQIPALEVPLHGGSTSACPSDKVELMSSTENKEYKTKHNYYESHDNCWMVQAMDLLHTHTFYTRRNALFQLAIPVTHLATTPKVYCLISSGANYALRTA